MMPAASLMRTRVSQEVRIVWELARNDFRARFVGSYFGLFWAFAQPLATVLLFWFVFQVGFRATPAEEDVPFGLWLAAGLAPWFFISEAWLAATQALTEYSYLVKKVVFRVELLPLVRILSALFFHWAFLTVLLALNWTLAVPPGWHLVQLPYYSFCALALVAALGSLTAAVLPFFRDLNQLLAIVIQFGMWLTPILWSVDRVPERFRWAFKLNPVGYVVDGYRDALFGKAWIWQHGPTTFGFWALTLVLAGAARLVFRRLRPHFADVL
jgi:teichoic acid transport system permease protein